MAAPSRSCGSRGGAAIDKSAWRRAIAAARADERLDLIVAPVGAKAAAGLVAYLSSSAERAHHVAADRSAQRVGPGVGGYEWWVVCAVGVAGGVCRRHGMRSLNAAYQAARAGDTILIRGGTYPTQKVNDRPDIPLGAAIDHLPPGAGREVTIDGSLELYGHDFIFDGGDAPGVNETNRVTIRGEDAPDEESLGMRDNQGTQNGQARNMIVEDVHIRNVKTSSDYSILRYSEIGPSDLGTGNLCSDLVQSADEPTKGWVIEYNIVHDNKNDGCSGAHIDAFDIYVTDGVIRGNRIWWCGTQCIFTGDPSSILIENNMIEETNACGGGCDGPQELAVMGTTTVRYNTIEGDDGYGRDPDRPGNATIYGNIFLSRYSGCAGGGAVTASYSGQRLRSRQRCLRLGLRRSARRGSPTATCTRTSTGRRTTTSLPTTPARSAPAARERATAGPRPAGPSPERSGRRRRGRAVTAPLPNRRATEPAGTRRPPGGFPAGPAREAGGGEGTQRSVARDDQDSGRGDRSNERRMPAARGRNTGSAERVVEVENGRARPGSSYSTASEQTTSKSVHCWCSLSNRSTLRRAISTSSGENSTPMMRLNGNSEASSNALPLPAP